ncbi:PREDICTED: peroxidase 57-like [Fragaria vesca subsp. vesca]|uniref:peroxidase 57-like n=1 Tax=Fragaria vesca subsp. vesca TaxID=101020 RepID=UPI0002C3285E|nr:PREDICTED: peroxidase 57-like [Fragaria vesca subsp. vesca]
MGRRLIALAILTFTFFTFIILPTEALPKPQQPKLQPQQPKPQPQQPKPQLQQPGPKPVVPQQPGPKPGVPQQPGPKPVVPQQPGPKPGVPQQPGPKPAGPQQPGPKPAGPQQPVPKPAGPQQPLPNQPGPQQPGPQQPGPKQPGPQQPGPQPLQEAGPNILRDGLSLGFYAKTCPKVENVVADVVKRVSQRDPKLPPALIRLLFHDCWVKGCDASILLDATPSGQAVEKLSDRNGRTLRGLEVIDEIKTQLEKECPRTVSCADILAFAAREAVILAGLPRYDVVAGRRDSSTSRAIDADESLPTPKDDLKKIIGMFNQRGFSPEDMVVLSGAHSIGAAQCGQVRDRLYAFAPNVPRDPAIDPAYAADLTKKCPAQPPPGPELFMVDLDPTTPLKLDNQYYLNLQKKRGLLQSDQVLATDPGTVGFVNQLAGDNAGWSRKFVNAMERLGKVSVLTGDEGQIRLNCRAFNK